MSTKVKKSNKSYPFTVMIILCAIVMGVFCLVKNSKDKAEKDNNSAVAEVSISSEELTKEETSKTETTAEENNSELATEIEDSSETESDSMTTEAATEPLSLAPVNDNSYFDDTLFIGNSRTEGLYLYKQRITQNATFYAIEGVSVFKIMDTSAPVPPQSGSNMSFKSCVTSKKFGKIYIMLGVNELGTGTDDSFAQKYSELIQYLKSVQPQAKIVIQSILHVSAQKSQTDPTVNNININNRNNKIMTLADNQTIFYLDVNKATDDTNGALNTDYTSDGFHLSGKATQIWEDYLYQNPVV